MRENPERMGRKENGDRENDDKTIFEKSGNVYRSKSSFHFYFFKKHTSITSP
jgi:hypothetical protein